MKGSVGGLTQYVRHGHPSGPVPTVVDRSLLLSVTGVGPWSDFGYVFPVLSSVYDPGFPRTLCVVGLSTSTRKDSSYRFRTFSKLLF